MYLYIHHGGEDLHGTNVLECLKHLKIDLRYAKRNLVYAKGDLVHVKRDAPQRRARVRASWPLLPRLRYAFLSASSSHQSQAPATLAPVLYMLVLYHIIIVLLCCYRHSALTHTLYYRDGAGSNGAAVPRKTQQGPELRVAPPHVARTAEAGNHGKGDHWFQRPSAHKPKRSEHRCQSHS